MNGHILEGDRQVQHLAPQGSGEVQLTPETIVLCCHRGRNALDEFGRLIREHGQRKRRPQDADNEPGARDRGVVYVGDYADTYDSRHYIIMPGYFSAPYGAALHFKQRAVVPGSRNPETNSEASFLTILGVAEPTTGGLRIVRRVDDLEDWEPFSDDECREYGMSVEALDRRHMIDPIVPADQVVVTDALTTGAGGKPPAKQPGKPSRVSGGQTTGKGPGAARGGRATQIETTASSVLEPVDPAEHAGLAEMRSDAAAAASEAGRG
jgi:hypothetical protein